MKFMQMCENCLLAGTTLCVPHVCLYVRSRCQFGVLVRLWGYRRRHSSGVAVVKQLCVFGSVQIGIQPSFHGPRRGWPTALSQTSFAGFEPLQLTLDIHLSIRSGLHKIRMASPPPCHPRLSWTNLFRWEEERPSSC